jgi:uncharacterized membrane protein
VLLRFLRRNLVSGVLVIAPMAVTIYVIVLGWEFARRAAAWLQRLFGLSFPEWLEAFLPILGVLAALIAIAVAGALAQALLGRWTLGLLERILGYVPIIRDVYNAVKRLAATLFSAQGTQFSKAALIEYPRPGIWALVFVVQRVNGALPNVAEGLTAVLLPTSPLPMSGVVLFVPSKDLIPLDVSVEEAFRVVVSAGFLLPDRSALRNSAGKTITPPPEA